MSQPDIRNILYFLKQESKTTKLNNEISNEALQKILQTLSKQVLKEKTPSIQDLEHILQGFIRQSAEQQNLENSENTQTDNHESSEPMTKYLTKQGYLKDEKKWLTNKGFFEIGGKLLRDVMEAINEGGLGFHETKNIGTGSIVQDTTKKFDLGDDIKFLNVQQTVLNAIQRISKKNPEIKFPIYLEIDDLEDYETIEEVKVAVVYCIDLSSTMKYSIGTGESSRIEAAKKALWSLYVLNKKFFPNDSIYIIGFGSFASEIDPRDIPYLKTFDSNDNFLHYTNYQSAFRLALKILKHDGAQNKRIVMITDGQPSACFIDNESQKNNILADKPYSHFYIPDEATLLKLKNEREIKLDTGGEMVYLCYRYRQVDSFIESRTLFEAKKCKREGIDVDTIMVSEEDELLNYVEGLEKQLKGRAYYINPVNIGKILINDFISNKKKILNSPNKW